jgi:hypothetical protein
MRSTAWVPRRQSRTAASLIGCVAIASILCSGFLVGGRLEAQVQRSRTTDSAGIAIVQNGNASGSPIAFTIGSTPILDIGGLQDDSLYELNARNGFLTASFLSAGRVAVGDAATIKVFGPDGKLIWFAGKGGSGPGDYGAILGVCSFRGDSVLVADIKLRRVTFYDAKGQLGRTSQIQGTPVAYPCMSGGVIIFRAGSREEFGDHRKRAAYSALSTIDGRVTTLGIFPDDGYGAFPRYATIAGTGSYFYVGDEDILQVRIYDATGRLVRVVRTSDAPQRISTEDRATALVDMLPRGATKKEVDEARTRLLATTEMPEFWPPIFRMLVEPSGRLWVTGRKLSGLPREWMAFNPSGLLIGRLKEELGSKWSRLRVLQFDADRVLVAAKDADGAAHVLVMPLKRI